jgi:hypothetical protein
MTAEIKYIDFGGLLDKPEKRTKKKEIVNYDVLSGKIVLWERIPGEPPNAVAYNLMDFITIKIGDKLFQGKQSGKKGKNND